MTRLGGAPFTERVPTYDELNWPSLVALKACGNSATLGEHLAKVIELYRIPEEVSEVRTATLGGRS